MQARFFRQAAYAGLCTIFLFAGASPAQLHRDRKEEAGPIQQAERVDAGDGITVVLVVRTTRDGRRKTDGFPIRVQLPAPNAQRPTQVSRLTTHDSRLSLSPVHRHPSRFASRLNGLTIVVDPGHGGSTGLNPTGCSSVVHGRRVYEKDLTLSIAKRLRRQLAQAGANVLMTRTTDVPVTLRDRSALANDNDAAVFLSVHIDYSPVPNAASGTTSYYHMDNAQAHHLAKCVVDAVTQVSGLPSRGARSDRVLYASGLGVLRGSHVPATLVEVGYLNNGRDQAKLVDPDFQERVAEAMAAGLERYVAEYAQ